MENVGGIKSKVFLRLLNYNPNEIDDMTANMDKLRTKSCIVTSALNQRKPAKNSFLVTKIENSIAKVETKLEETDENKIDNTDNSHSDNNNNVTNNVEIVEIKRTGTKSVTNESKKHSSVDVKQPIAVIEAPKGADEKSEIFNYYSQRPDSADRGTTLSESKIRHMVQQFKSSLQFKPKDNIIRFLNNKVSCL